ncbi:MAG: hypothetical protein ABW252_17450 [Polyangiales bacterium]
MMNRRWLGGMFAASMLLVTACEGDGSSDALDEQLDDALSADFDTAEHRVLPDGGVAAGGGRGDCRGTRRGRAGRGRGDRDRVGRGADGGVRADDDVDVDVDQDEAADEVADSDDRRQKGAGHDGGVRGGRGGRGDDRCVGGGGGRNRDGGAPVRLVDGGIAVGGGGRPRRDAGTTGSAGDAASTVTLPDGSTVRLDPTCPALARGGFNLPGCCLPANTCGLSTHLIDVTGVPKGCQTYDQGRQVDPSFDLSDKACTFRN